MRPEDSGGGCRKTEEEKEGRMRQEKYAGVRTQRKSKEAGEGRRRHEKVEEWTPASISHS